MGFEKGRCSVSQEQNSRKLYDVEDEPQPMDGPPKTKEVCLPSELKEGKTE